MAPIPKHSTWKKSGTKNGRINSSSSSSSSSTSGSKHSKNCNAKSNIGGKIKVLDCPQAADFIRTAYNNNYSASSASRRGKCQNNTDRVLFVVTTDASCKPRPSTSPTTNFDANSASNRSGVRVDSGDDRVDNADTTTAAAAAPSTTHGGGEGNASRRDNTPTGTTARSDVGHGQSTDKKNGSKDNEKHSGVAVVIRRIGSVCVGGDDGAQASHRTAGQPTRKNLDGRAAAKQTAKGKSLSDAIEVDDSDDEEDDNRHYQKYNHLLPAPWSNSGDTIKIVLASTFLVTSSAAETLAWNVAIETLLRDGEARTLLNQGKATVLMLSDNTSTIEFYENHCDLNACQYHFVPTHVASRWKQNLEKLIRLTNGSSNSMSSASASAAAAAPFGSSSSSSQSSTVIGIAKVRGLRDGSFAPMGFFDHSAADLLSAIARYEQPKFDQWRPNIPKLSDVDLLWLEHSTNKSFPNLKSYGKRKLSVQEMICSEWGIDLVPLLHDGYSRNIHPVAAVKTPAVDSLKRMNKQKHSEAVNDRTNNSIDCDPFCDNITFTAASLPVVRASLKKSKVRDENRKSSPLSSTNRQTSSTETVGAAYLPSSKKEGMSHAIQDIFDWLHALTWEHGDGHGQIIFYKLGGQWKTVNKSGDILACPHELNENFPALLQEHGTGQFESYDDTEKKNFKVVRSLKRPTRNIFPDTSVTPKSHSFLLPKNQRSKRKRMEECASASASAAVSGSDRTSSRVGKSTGAGKKRSRKNSDNEIAELLDDDEDGDKEMYDGKELSIIDLCDDSVDESD